MSVDVFSPDAVKSVGSFVWETPYEQPVIETQASPQSVPQLLTVEVAAREFLGMTSKALRRRIERGQIECVRVGRRVYLRLPYVLKIVREGCGLSPGGSHGDK